MSTKSTAHVDVPAPPASPRAAGIVLRRKCDCGNHTAAGACDPCKSKTESGARRTLQRSAMGSNLVDEVPLIVHEVLRSPGQPLDATTRAFFEPRFRQDFSRVRVHTDTQAADATSTVAARAFTSNRNIVFAAGEYAPHSESGRRLLSHELTHVVQQQAGIHPKGGIGEPGDRYERQADDVASDVSAGRMPVGINTLAPIAPESLAIQRQKKPGTTGVNARNSARKKDLEALVADLKARLVFLINQNNNLKSAYTVEKMGQLQAIPSAGQHVHQALAYAFIKHNPGARIKSMNNAAVSIDTRDIPTWKEKEPLEDYSHGTYLATRFPDYKKFFITGPGTVWITLAGVKAYPDEYKDFLWRSGSVPEAELAEIMDPWYKQAAHAVGKYMRSLDSETPREAPLLVQFIADLNPLMAVAKLISLFKDNKALYAMPGTKATTSDWVEAYVGLALLGESILGDLLKVSAKGVQAAKITKVASKMLNPFEELIDEGVKIWSKDEVVQKILAKIIEQIVDMTVDKGIVHPLEEFLGTEPKGKQPLGPAQK